MKKFKDFSPFGIDFSTPTNDFFVELKKVEKKLKRKKAEK